MAPKATPKLQVNMIVVTIVVRRNWGENSSAMLGRFKRAGLRFFAATPATRAGTAESRSAESPESSPDIKRVTPIGVGVLDSSEKAQEARAAGWPATARRAGVSPSNSGAGLFTAQAAAMPLAMATIRPPIDEKACV